MVKRYSRDRDKIDLMKCTCSFELKVAAIIVGTNGSMRATFLPRSLWFLKHALGSVITVSHCSQKEF